MKIDAHLHLWRRARGDYGWLSENLGPLWRDFEPHDAAAELTANGIAKAILVQAAPTVEETRFLLDIATDAPWAAGVIGWVDLNADDVGQSLESLAQNPMLRGIRPMVQDEPDLDWLLRPDVARGLTAVQRADLAFDALVRPPYLANLHTVIARNPELRFVLDHGGKPDLARGELGGWARDIRSIAVLPNVACKLSGLITERGQGWTLDDLRPAFDVMLEAFGPDRLMWGSDWPVVTLAGSYVGWTATADTLTAALSPSEKAAIFGGTAQRVYRLDVGQAP